MGNVDVRSYISGYVDGEGCFSVSISPRPSLLVGWEVRPSLSVSQNADRSQVLLTIQEYFGCGNIRTDRSDRTLKWEVRKLSVLLERVIPHFKAYPLISDKQSDFIAFAEICQRMKRGDHLKSESLVKIVDIVKGMNPSGKRGYLPDMIIDELMRDEGIVYSFGNKG
jgi:hypothetical protein